MSNRSQILSLQFAGAVFFALALTAAQTHAQPRFEYRPELLHFNQSASRLVWKLKQNGQTREVAQSYVPASLSFVLSPRTNVELATAAGLSQFNQTVSYELNGLSDVRFRISHRLSGDRWFLGAGFNLPTGKNKLDASENAVVNLLTENILGFPMQRTGVGLDAELSIAHALNLSDKLGLGLGTNLILPGKFEYLANDSAQYQPGARFNFNVMLNSIGTPVKWRVNVLAQFFANDKLNQQNFFKQGWQLEPEVAIDWRINREWNASGSFRYVHKAENKLLGLPTSITPPAHFYIDNSALGNLMIDRNFGKNTALGLQLATQAYGKSNQQLSRATIGRVGLRVTQKFSEHWMLGASGVYAVGKAEAGELSLRGYSLAFGLQARL
ncbi:MAG: hypothetical protein AAB354_14225 [candidate division KSB1 bacterium]